MQEAWVEDFALGGVDRIEGYLARRLAFDLTDTEPAVETSHKAAAERAATDAEPTRELPNRSAHEHAPSVGGVAMTEIMSESAEDAALPNIAPGV